MRLLRIPSLFLLLLAAGAACERRQPAAAAPGAAPVAASASPAAAAPGSAGGAGAIVFDRERAIDLTGDGVPEAVHIRAVGPRWDALHVRLEIRGGGTVLYADTFTTAAYTGLDPDPHMSAADIAHTVRSALENDLSGDAFGERPDTAGADLRGDFAAWKWSVAHHAPIPVERDSAFRAAADQAVKPEEYDRFLQDVLSHPMYRYYVGGETSVGISWSTIMKAFVRTWDCC